MVLYIVAIQAHRAGYRAVGMVGSHLELTANTHNLWPRALALVVARDAIAGHGAGPNATGVAMTAGAVTAGNMRRRWPIWLVTRGAGCWRRRMVVDRYGICPGPADIPMAVRAIHRLVMRQYGPSRFMAGRTCRWRRQMTVVTAYPSYAGAAVAFDAVHRLIMRQYRSIAFMARGAGNRHRVMTIGGALPGYTWVEMAFNAIEYLLVGRYRPRRFMTAGAGKWRR